MKKRLVAFLLVLIMVLGMLPVSAFAADDGVSPQALESNETQTIKYQILYVGDEFNIGYNYGVSVNKTYTCQYSTGHSGFNHSILISEFRNVGVPALKGQLDSGYEFVGWAKEAKKNPTIFDFNTAGTTATQTTYTIYLVAKKAVPPTVTYTLTYYPNTTDLVTNMPSPNPVTQKSSTSPVTFTVSSAIPAREGYNFLGWNGKPDATTPTVQPGNWVTTPATATRLYAVWQSNTPPTDKPDKPTKNDVTGVVVDIVCVTTTGTHDTVQYPLGHPTDAQHTIGEVVSDGAGGYICPVTVRTAWFVQQASNLVWKVQHTPTAQTITFNLTYDKNSKTWVKPAANPRIEATHEVTPPTKPTALDGSFAIVCKNNKATHPYKADYIATPSQYTISDVQMDDQGYYVTATVTVAPNLVAYNNDTRVEHRLVDEQDATLTITFRYDTEATGDGNRKWQQQGDLPVVEVICKPKAPTADELKKLEMAVQVKCVVDASQQHTAAYGLLGECDVDYFVFEPRQEGDDWLCDISYYPERYVAEFNTTFQNLKHVQNDEKIVPVTLIWAGGSWQIKTQGRVHVTEEYTVTYTDGVDGEEVFADQVYSDLRKDSTTPAFNGTPTRTGYTFAGWEPEVAATVTQTVTYVAKWEAKKANVHLMIFKSGDLSTPIVNVPYTTDKLAGDTIDLAEIDLSSYLDFDFEIDGGWYDDGLFNLYKKYVNGEQENKPAALTELQITGNWQNLKLIVTELVPVVYYMSDADRVADNRLFATTARVGSALPTANAPTATREGYTFTFWSREGQLGTDVTGQTVNGWTNLVANWKANTYTVKFAPNGGEGTMADQNFTYDVEQALTANAFTRTGYTFTGWKDDGNTYTDGQKVKNLTAEPDGTVTLYAQWEARTDTPYTVEHYLENLDGSYALDTTEPLKGTTDTTVTAAAKSYDNFTYDSTVPGTVASGNIAGDGSLVLKLFYTRNTYDYTVRHIKQLPDGSYDEANAEVETLSGKFEALAAVTAKDYGSHYPTNDADTKQNIKIEKGLTIDVKYDLDEHTLTFETNGGSTINPVTVRHGNAVARPADPTKDKYTFIGWYADPEFTEEYDFATVLEADKTIYAKFELTSTPIGDIYVRYDVLHIKQLPDGTYDLANAEVEHLSAKKDTTVTAVIKDYRATHHVNVNRTLSKLTGTAIQPYMGVDGKPVYTILSVYYDLDFHTLTFDTMGGSKIAPETVRHGLTVAKPKDPVNGGYIFDGWYTDKTFRHRYDFSTPLTEDITIYAKWFLIVLPGVTVKKNTPKLNTADHFAYVQGYPDGTVKPAGNITRAETAAILFRLMDDASRKTYYSTKSGFRDVASGSWYNTYVATLNNAGVITDSSNGYFRPNEAITRAELAAMLAKFSETTGAANYFNDVSAKYWAANAIAICAKLGWITGYPDGTFRPDKNVTRAELMAMINRATGRAPKSADAFLPGMKTWSDNTADKWYYLDVQEATNSHSYTVKGSETWTALTSDPNWSLYE